MRRGWARTRRSAIGGNEDDFSAEVAERQGAALRGAGGGARRGQPPPRSTPRGAANGSVPVATERGCARAARSSRRRGGHVAAERAPTAAPRRCQEGTEESDGGQAGLGRKCCLRRERPARRRAGRAPCGARGALCGGSWAPSRPIRPWAVGENLGGALGGSEPATISACTASSPPRSPSLRRLSCVGWFSRPTFFTGLEWAGRIKSSWKFRYWCVRLCYFYPFSPL